MSWLTKYVEHPFVNAIEGLTQHPAIAENPTAAAAVADAKSQAQQLASATTTAAAVIVSDAQVASDPALAALTSGLETGVDAYLTAAIGAPGAAMAGPIVHVIFTLGEAKAHDVIAALFAKAKGLLPASPNAPALPPISG